METHLTIDIGNTSISLAVMSGQRRRWQASVDGQQTEAELRRELIQSFKAISTMASVPRSALVCSVVPKRTAMVCRLLKQRLKISALIVGKDIRVPIANKYKEPAQVGQDRLLVAFAAQQLYGQPAVIVDFGTAITLDVVSAQGHYEGGVIVPGIRLSLESLYNKTALLPKVEEVRRPRRIIGKTTEHSIVSGLVYGYGEMCHGLISRIMADLDGCPRVVVTGGYARLMVHFLQDYRPVVDQLLVHKGLMLLEDR